MRFECHDFCKNVDSTCLKTLLMWCGGFFALWTKRYFRMAEPQPFVQMDYGHLLTSSFINPGRCGAARSKIIITGE